MKEILNWQKKFERWFYENVNSEEIDGSHDLTHVQRVLSTASYLAAEEEVDWTILMAAIYFHDIVCFPKNSKERSLSSKFSAEKATEILKDMNFPEEKIPAVAHAIIAHSFTANVTPETLEAKILQDADRMEALGALGVMRAFYVSGKMGGWPYDESDPGAKNRELDDSVFGLDHFETKLFKLKNMMQTEVGKKEADKRTLFLENFRASLIDEIEEKAVYDFSVIADVFYLAGHHKIQLIHPGDPFASDRDFDSSKYALDKLIENNLATWFVDQLKSELTVFESALA